MDPLSFTASLVAIIGLSQTVLVACYRLQGQIKDAEKDVSSIIADVQALTDIMEEFREITQGPDEADEILKSLSLSTAAEPGNGGKQPVFTACLSALEACDSALRYLSGKLGPLSKPGFRSKLMWPLQASAVEQKLGIINRQKTTLSLALSVYQTRLLATHIRKAAREKQDTKKSKVVSWFKTSNPEQNHAISRGKHEPGTATWIFHEDAFVDWESAMGGLLWVHGIPGAGKTVLSSTIIDHLETAIAGGNPGTKRLAYYYFDFADSRKHSVADMLKSVIYQLLCTTSGESEAAVALYNSKCEGTEEPTVEELLGVLTAEVALTDVTYLVIDALDECPGPRGERQLLFKGFLNNEKLPGNLKVLVTSRKEPDIEAALESILAHMICIQSFKVDRDVRVYVKGEIERDATLKRWQPTLKKEILDGIVLGAHGMFRWAVCQLEAIKQCLTPAMVKKELGQMPEDLDHTYDRILQALLPRHQAFVQSALHWLAFSSRPLLLEELAEAAVIDPSQSDFNLDLARFMVSTSILDVCGVLLTTSTIGEHYHPRPEWLQQRIDVEVEAGAIYPELDQPYTVVSLSHYSVKEYITSQRLGVSPLSLFYTSEQLAHRHIAQCCLQYLLSYNEGTIAFDLRISEFSLLQYVSRYWIRHWRRAFVFGDPASSNLSSGTARALLERFLVVDPTKCQPYLNWLNIYDPEYMYKPKPNSLGASDFHLRRSHSLDQRPSALYWAAGLGDLVLVRGLVAKGADINKHSRDAHFGTALGVAAACGRLKIVEYLLSQGADPNTPDRRHGSTLQLAARYGAREVVQRLLDAGADASFEGGEGESALLAAALGGHYEVVELLTERGVDAGGRGTTEALCRAARGEDQKIVEKLLEAGASVTNPDIHGWAPLSHAVSSGSLPMVELLIRHGADVNPTTKYGRDRRRMPLTFAAGKGFSEITSALLRAGANPNPADCEPPLVAAIVGGDMATFKILLDAGADPTTTNSPYHMNSFHAAMDWRQFAMAQLLFARFPDVPYGDATFLDAVRFYNECPAIFDILMATRNVNIDALGDAGSALHVALQVRSEAAAWRILNKNPYIHTMTMLGTPLTAAIEGGFVSIAKELIRRGASVHPREFARPHKPLEHGYPGSERSIIPKWLRKMRARFRCYITIKDRILSPFECAVLQACGVEDEHKDTEMLDHLLDQGVDLRDEKEDIGESLRWLIDFESPSILRYLASKGMDLNRQLPDYNECNAIQYAAEDNQLEFVKLLVELGADINGPPGGRGTSLYYGFMSNNREVVAFLLDNGAKVVERTSDGNGSNVLVPAIEHGLGDEFLPVLLDMGANPNLVDDYLEVAALPEAAYLGSRSLVELLKMHGATFADAGMYPLIQAASEKSIEEIRWLLEIGAGLNIKGDNNGYGSPLIEASRMGRKDVINLLLESGMNINSSPAQDTHLYTVKVLLGIEEIRQNDMTPRGALAVAVDHDDIDMATFLLGKGADPNSWHHSAMYIALRRGCVAMIDLLLGYGANVSAGNGKCFGYAVWGGERALSRLLQQPMSAAQRYEGVNKALQTVLNLSDIGISLWLLDKQGTDANFTGGLFGSPLQAALAYTYPTDATGLYEQRSRLVDVLLARGANPNPPPTETEIDEELVSRGLRHKITTFPSPLVLAIRAATVDRPSDSTCIPRRLLAAGADPEGMEKDDMETPLQTAADDPAVIELLLAAGADVNAIRPNTKSGTALHAAALSQNLESIKILLASGASVHASAGKYGSVVQCAAKIGNLGLVDNHQLIYAQSVRAMELLVAAGADEHAGGGRYGSALQVAAKLGNLDGMMWLIKRGANVYVEGGKWGNIHNAAVMNRRWGVVSWLERIYGREVWEALDRKMFGETGACRSGEVERCT